MILIGEKLNSSIPKTFQAMQAGDGAYIKHLITTQAAAGADYLDINTAICGTDELKKMQWVVGLALAHASCGIMIDSPSADIILQTIPLLHGRKCIINSVSLTERLDALLPTIVDTQCGVVALPIGENGMPKTTAEKFANAEKLIAMLSMQGVKHENIYVDVLAEALATDDASGPIAIETIKAIKGKYPHVHVTCGLSNVSFGLPKRVHLNNAFLAAAVFAGLDSAILDVTNATTKLALYASLAVAGQDEYCMNYLKEVRRDV